LRIQEEAWKCHCNGGVSATWRTHLTFPLISSPIYRADCLNEDIYRVFYVIGFAFSALATCLAISSVIFRVFVLVRILF